MASNTTTGPGMEPLWAAATGKGPAISDGPHFDAGSRRQAVRPPRYGDGASVLMALAALTDVGLKDGEKKEDIDDPY